MLVRGLRTRNLQVDLRFPLNDLGTAILRWLKALVTGGPSAMAPFATFLVMRMDAKEAPASPPAHWLRLDEEVSASAASECVRT